MLTVKMQQNFELVLRRYATFCHAHFSQLNICIIKQCIRIGIELLRFSIINKYIMLMHLLFCLVKSGPSLSFISLTMNK